MPDPAITEYKNDGVAMNALAMLNNRLTGLGQGGRDKYLEHTIALDFTPLTRPDLQALYRKSKICEKVVDLLPKAATAENWIEVTVGKGRKGIPAKAVQYSEDLKLRTAIREAAIMGRLDGDGFVIVGVDDGGQPWEPVNEGRIRKLSWVYPVDRWRIQPETTTGRPGNPELYSLYLPFTDALPNQQVSGKIHRSRVLRFPGKKLWGDMITYNTGYNDSVLQTFFQSFVKYLIAIEYSTRMVQDYNVFTYKLQGLAQLILQGDEEKIFHRFQAILMSMSSLGGLAMDADKESAEFVSRNFSGLDTLIDRLKDDTSAAAAMPPTKLWGSSQKTALSNSAEGDKYEWADCVADYRSEILAEPTSDFFRLVFLAQNGPTGGRLPESWGVTYRSALRLNLKEQTALRKDQTMGVDVPSVTAGILLKEEVRESAWSGNEYTIERQLQPDLWAKQQAERERAGEAGDKGQGENEGDPTTTPDDGLGTRTDDGGSEAPNPKELIGGTNHIDAASSILSVIDRADKLLQGLEDGAIERVNSALESSYQDLEAQILRSYSLETPGSLMGRDRAAVLLSQVADLLGLINTRNAEEIQQSFEDLLRGADAQGATLADDLSRAIANQSLQTTANVPVAAIVNQATEGMTRLRNHTEAFAAKVSTIVSQGLIQGWGTDKVASLLQKEMGLVRHKAETIARTESLAASNGAIAETLKANNYSLFQFFATSDDRVCPFCSARNQKVYRLGESQPPLHPRCRCVMVGFKQEHLDLGLVDTAWSDKFRNSAIAELQAKGMELNNGASPFEKANGLDAPEPVWEPGERSDGLECDEWREDAGTPCGKGWIRAGAKCSKGVSSQHPSANPDHAGHAAYQGALAAATGIHNHAAAQSNHPDHAAYKAGFDAHGGTSPLPLAGGSGGAKKTTKKKQQTTPVKKAAASKSTATAKSKKAAVKEPQPTPEVATAKPATTKAAKKTSAKKKSVAPEAAKGATHPDFEPLHAMANGTKPNELVIPKAQLQAAKDFMSGAYAGSQKQKQIQKEGKTTAEESLALSHWLGHSYTTMSKRIWNPGAVADENKGILTANILATQALHKLPPVTAEQVQKGAQAKGHFNFDSDKPLNRWMNIPKAHVEAFVKKYQDAEGGEIHEDNFFGTSHLGANQMGGFSMGANVIYKVKAKIDGTGQGRYVDHFKKTMDEGEILFPPYSKFKVVKVTTPTQGKPASLTAKEKDAIAFHDKHADSIEEALNVSSLLGTSLHDEFKSITKGEKLPSDWTAKLALATDVKAKQVKAHSGSYIIELHEV